MFEERMQVLYHAIFDRFRCIILSMFSCHSTYIMLFFNYDTRITIGGGADISCEWWRQSYSDQPSQCMSFSNRRFNEKYGNEHVYNFVIKMWIHWCISSHETTKNDSPAIRTNTKVVFIVFDLWFGHNDTTRLQKAITKRSTIGVKEMRSSSSL